MDTRYAIATWFAAALFLAGCEPKDTCTELGNCGGELVGASDDDSDSDGIVEAHYSVNGTCMGEVFNAPQNASLVNQPPPLQGQPPPEPAAANWCSEMVLKADKTISKLSPWFPVLPFQAGGVTYDAAGISLPKSTISARWAPTFRRAVSPLRVSASSRRAALRGPTR